MKRMAIVLRHGECYHQKYNDGPLTEGGAVAVRLAAKTIRNILTMEFPNDIHDPIRYRIAVLVSGSLRGLDTYRILRQELERTGLFTDGLFRITAELIHTNFFSTPDEDAIWRGLRKDATFDAATKELGWNEALLRHQLPLVKGPADRVVTATKAFPEEVVIIINHSPHDRLIVEGLTGTRPTDALELGKFRIVEFE